MSTYRSAPGITILCIACVLSLSLLTACAQKQKSRSAPTTTDSILHMELKEASDTINKTLPKKIEENIFLTNTRVTGNTIELYYHVSTLNPDTMDLELFKQRLIGIQKMNLCRNPSFTFLLAHGATAKVIILDANKNFYCSVEVTKDLCGFRDQDELLSKVLQEKCDELNKMLPIESSSDTTLEHASVSGKTITLDISLKNYTKDIFTQKIKKEIQKEVVQAICNDSNYDFWLENDVTLFFNSYDKNKNLLFTFDITSHACE